MGILDEIGGMLGGSQPSGGLNGTIISMLSGADGGGLTALLQQLTAAGHGDLISSWLGNGANLPISAEQISNALGHGKLQELATQIGVPTSQASGALAALLPELIDKLSPNGSMPSGSSLLAQAAAMFGSR